MTLLVIFVIDEAVIAHLFFCPQKLQNNITNMANYTAFYQVYTPNT